MIQRTACPANHRLIGSILAALLGVFLLSGCSSAKELPADTIAVVPGPVYVGGTDAPVGKNWIAMPHASMTVESARVTDELAEQHAAQLDLGDEDVVAPDGYEIVIATAYRSGAPFHGEGSPVISVVAGDKAWDVTASYPDAESTVSRPVLYVVVEKDVPVYLTIADEGVTQRLDLRTGARVEDDGAAAAAPYYAPVQSTQIVGELTTAGVATSQKYYVFGPQELTPSLSLINAEARRHAWLPTIGWAPAGQAFLVVSGIGAAMLFNPVMGSITLKVADSLALTVDGAPVAPLGISVPVSTIGIDTGAVVWQVPVDAAHGVLTFTPQVTFSDDWTWASPPGSASVEFALA